MGSVFVLVNGLFHSISCQKIQKYAGGGAAPATTAADTTELAERLVDFSLKRETKELQCLPTLMLGCLPV